MRQEPETRPSEPTRAGGARTFDRRLSARIPVEGPQQWRFRMRNGSPDSVVTDVSEGGLCVKSTKPAPTGTQVEFEVRTPDGLPVLDGRGRVAWSRETARFRAPAGMGVRFEGLGIRGFDLVQSALEAARARAAGSESGVA